MISFNDTDEKVCNSKVYRNPQIPRENSNKPVIQLGTGLWYERIYDI